MKAVSKLLQSGETGTVSKKEREQEIERGINNLNAIRDPPGF